MRSTSSGHGRHLVATYRALIKQLEEIEQAAVHGRGPGGQRAEPLPPALWAKIAPLLEHLREQAEATARRNAADSFRESDSRQPVQATLRWTALLLHRLEETLEDLEPGGIARKFGPFPDPEEVKRMEGEVGLMHEDLSMALNALEAWRNPAKAEDLAKE